MPTNEGMNVSDAIDPESTLGDLVTAIPALAAPLDRLGLDYCCGGGRSLAGAVRAADGDLDDVLAILSDAAEDSAGQDREEWATLGPTDLVDHLEVTPHAYLRDSLPRLEALAAKVSSVHGDRHPELIDVHRVVVEIRSDLEPHLLKEERVLFPMIRELASATDAPEFHCGTIANPIRMMGIEHDRAGELLAQLREVTRGYAVPADGCASYDALFRELAAFEADTHLHVHKENNVLFPAVLALETQHS